MALFFVNFSDFPLLALVVEPVGTISLKDRKKNAFFYNKYKEKQRVIFNRYRYRWYENISKPTLSTTPLTLDLQSHTYSHLFNKRAVANNV